MENKCSKCVFQLTTKDYNSEHDFRGFTVKICNNPQSERYNSTATRHYSCSKFQEKPKL